MPSSPEVAPAVKFMSSRITSKECWASSISMDAGVQAVTTVGKRRLSTSSAASSTSGVVIDDQDLAGFRRHALTLSVARVVLKHMSVPYRNGCDHKRLWVRSPIRRICILILQVFSSGCTELARSLEYLAPWISQSRRNRAPNSSGRSSAVAGPGGPVRRLAGVQPHQAARACASIRPASPPESSAQGTFREYYPFDGSRRTRSRRCTWISKKADGSRRSSPKAARTWRRAT